MATQKPSFWKTPSGFAALVLIGVVSYFLLMEHREHVWQLLPYLFLLACPLLHLFMHGSHGGHAGHGNHGNEVEYQQTERSEQHNEHHH